MWESKYELNKSRRISMTANLFINQKNLRNALLVQQIVNMTI